MKDSIQIHGLQLRARVGVPDEERATPQRLTANVQLWPKGECPQNDDIATAVDYAAVARAAAEFVAGRCDKLIETTADALAQHLLRAFALQRIVLELRKFPLKEAEYVAVTVTRECKGQ